MTFPGLTCTNIIGIIKNCISNIRLRKKNYALSNKDSIGKSDKQPRNTHLNLISNLKAEDKHELVFTILIYLCKFNKHIHGNTS